MTTITVSYKMPEEMDEFASAHYSDVAWAAIREAYNAIRQHKKHDQGTPKDVLENVYFILGEAQAKRDA